MITAELRGHKELIIFNRRIPREHFRKAFVVGFMLLGYGFLWNHSIESNGIL